LEIGIISDTHGTLYQKAVDALRDVDQILHAGDIGSPEVLQALQKVAPTKAVRGNTDGGPWCENLPASDMLEIDDTTIYLLHDLHTLDLDPQSAGIQIVVHGHTHQPANRNLDGILYFNPGSASHRRHGAPLSVGRIKLIDGRIVGRIITLDR
jgi:putative phosphoesterase